MLFKIIFVCFFYLPPRKNRRVNLFGITSKFRITQCLGKMRVYDNVFEVLSFNPWPSWWKVETREFVTLFINSALFFKICVKNDGAHRCNKKFSPFSYVFCRYSLHTSFALFFSTNRGLIGIFYWFYSACWACY